MPKLAKTFPNEAAARAEIALIDAACGYPRVERGTRVGKGKHAASIVTTTACEPVELDNGTWAVPLEALEKGGRPTAGAVDVSARRRPDTSETDIEARVVASRGKP